MADDQFSRGLSEKGAKMAAKTDGEAKTDGDEAGQEKGGKKKLLFIVGPVVLIVIVAAVYFLFLKPSGSEGEKAKPKPVPGEVLTLDPITINLSGGHFLKLGMALQADANAAGGHGELSGAKAYDAAIELFSGKTITELSTKEGRNKAKEKLIETVAEEYEDEVYDIYFTQFVYQ